MASDVLFNVEEIIGKMKVLENHFTAFSDYLKEINSYIETKINVDESSAVFGIYGSKILSIWNQNASTFGDFHANFTAWSEVVSVIAAAKQNFTVETTALYKNNGSNLDGVQNARAYLQKEETSLSKDGKKVLNSAKKIETENVINDGSKLDKNLYGGKTIEYDDYSGNHIIKYYDKDGNFIAKVVKDKDGNKKYYNYNNKEVEKLPTIDEYKKYIENEKQKIHDSVEKSRKIVEKTSIKSYDFNELYKYFENDNLQKIPDGTSLYDIVDEKEVQKLISDINSTYTGREAAVNCALGIIALAAEKGYKLDYDWGGGHGRISTTNDVANGVDCSGFASWAIDQGTNYEFESRAGGFDYLGTEEKYEDVKPGDVLVSPTHVVFVIANDPATGRFLCAEAADTDIRVILSKRSYDSCSNYSFSARNLDETYK